MNQQDSDTCLANSRDEAEEQNADEERQTVVYRETNTTSPWAILALMVLSMGLIALLVGWKMGAVRFGKPEIPNLQTPARETSAPAPQRSPGVANRERSDEERFRRLFEKLRATLVVLQQ